MFRPLAKDKPSFPSILLVEDSPDAITRAHNSGLLAIPMLANYGAYWLYDGATGQGVRMAIGTSVLSVANYATLWQKLSAALNGQAGIAAYGLMREPIGMPGVTYREVAERACSPCQSPSQTGHARDRTVRG